uniref:Si:dkey-14o18.2 n=1 Tax=Cyclopterus lumpus TaxID=8103 RepID=A0A8C3G1L4_CYCLU
MARDVSPLSLGRRSARLQQWDGASLGLILPFFPLRSLVLYYFLSCAASATGSLPGIEYDYGISPKFVCTPIPPEADPSCYSPPSVPHGRRGVMSDEAKATILHLRESLVRQKETILDQRETIRELTAKLTFDHHYSHGGHRPDPHPRKGSSYGKHSSFSPEQTGKTLQTLKERLENLQVSARNSSSSYSSSLRELLQRKITALEEQLHNPKEPEKEKGTGRRYEKSLSRGSSQRPEPKLFALSVSPGNHKKLKTPSAFLLDFPMKTNYMYARMKRSPVNEIFALTICLRLKAGAGPGLGTPFSYAVPGQANELVLIEWGSNPMELLISDKAVALPMAVSDGKWHHVCVTWTTRDGVWEAYQDGVKKGSGQNLSAWRPIEPGGTFVLGQEQVRPPGRSCRCAG